MGDRRLFRASRPRDDAADVETSQPGVEPVAEQISAIPPGSPHAIDESCVRALITVRGVIEEVSLGSRGDAPALQASLSAREQKNGEACDVTLVWLGRSQIAGVEPGREVVATARICDEAGTPVMYNPRYDLR